jgi:hypothetical protein
MEDLLSDGDTLSNSFVVKLLGGGRLYSNFLWCCPMIRIIFGVLYPGKRKEMEW